METFSNALWIDKRDKFKMPFCGLMARPISWTGHYITCIPPPLTRGNVEWFIKIISERCAVAFFADGGDGVIGDGVWFREGFGVGEVVSAAVSTTQCHIANSAFSVVGCVVLNEALVFVCSCWNLSVQ